MLSWLDLSGGLLFACGRLPCFLYCPGSQDLNAKLVSRQSRLHWWQLRGQPAWDKLEYWLDFLKLSRDWELSLLSGVFEGQRGH